MFRSVHFRILTVLLLIAAISIYAQVSDLMHYPVEDFTADTAYRVLKVETPFSIEIEYEGKPTMMSLLGVDTVSTPYQAAEDLLNDLLVGEWVYLRFGKKKEAPGFVNVLQSYVYRAPDGLFVNLELIRLGYGKVKQHSGERMQLFQYYEDRARSQDKGLWYKLNGNEPKRIKVKKLWDVAKPVAVEKEEASEPEEILSLPEAKQIFWDKTPPEQRLKVGDQITIQGYINSGFIGAEAIGRNGVISGWKWSDNQFWGDRAFISIVSQPTELSAPIDRIANIMGFIESPSSNKEVARINNDLVKSWHDPEKGLIRVNGQIFRISPPDPTNRYPGQWGVDLTDIDVELVEE